MDKEIIVIDGIKYLIEKKSYNLSGNKFLSKFVMFRNFDIKNNITIDSDLYFINYDDFYNKYDNIIWPIINGKNKKYSKLESDFNKLFASDLTTYNIYEDELCKNIAYIPCDEIKIYKPILRNNKNSIIHISNIINDINVHYFCQLYEDQEIHICDEFEYYGEKYNEYISFYIPNIEFLFKDNLYWYIEDLNLYIDLYSYDNSILNKLDNTINKEINSVELSKLINMYMIQNHNDNYVKVFLKNKNITEFNYINVPLSVCFTEYDSIENNSFETNFNTGIALFINDNKFSLKSKIGFDDDGIISLINEFEYPNQELFDNVEEAYFFYNKIENKEDYYNFDGWENSGYYDLLNDEYEMEFNLVSFNAAGYYIEISVDSDFTNVIYQSQHETKKIQNFAFGLNEIFTSWKQWPGSLFARSIYIDKYLSKIIYGNTVVITKEQFKYCINNSKIYKLNLIDKLSNNMDLNNFNFIDKINCVIKKNDTTEKITNNIGTNSNKILYKPIFYKVNDSQNIKIRQNVTQNIGINLGNYLTKVETFILSINDYKFTEYGRNDSYIIFKVNANAIQEKAGSYDILNQDYEYITSGNYSVF